MFDVRNDELNPVVEPEWIRGLPNLLRSELASWWRTRKWLAYSILLSFLINFMVFLLFSIDEQVFNDAESKIRQGLTFYAIFGFIASSAAIIIAMQDSIIGEKQSGTASWVLSKPLSRRSFVLAKFISNSIGAMITMILIPGTFVWLQIGLFQGEWLSVVGMIKAIGLLMINGLFFLTLTLLLGTLFDNRAPLLGVALGFLFGMQYLTSINENLIEIIPYPIGNPVMEDPLVVQAIYNESLWTWNPVIFCLFSSVIFLLLAVMKFDREEF